jgi:protein TonB
MSRDLFADSSNIRHAPRRSPWTIAASALAHAALLGVLLVVPILSALDNFVLHADDSMTYVMPAVTLPPMPPPPRTIAGPSAPAIDTTAAPLHAADHFSPPAQLPPGTGNSSVPDALPFGGGGTPTFGTGSSVVSLAPPPTPAVPRRPGGDVKAPARMFYVPPIYPPIAKSIKLEGSVVIEATIDENGAVRNAHVIQSQPLLDQAAIDAVSQWKYAPTRLNGVAVPVILTVTVVFAIK